MKLKILKNNALKAYKVFNPDWTCRAFQYEVGKSYHHKGNIEICFRGFHACVMAVDCFSYYSFTPDNKIAEVLCWGQLEKSEEDSKICCSNIQIVKELSWEEVLSLCNTGKGNSGYRNTGNGNSGNSNSGAGNTGNNNHGYWNAGDRNYGDRNSGDYNSGAGNTGSYNAGNCNSGNNNYGDSNTGNCNLGDYNSGRCNSGNWNSGNWNSGDWNSGYFNTPAQDKMFCFNKPTKQQKIEFPCFLYFELTEWVHVSKMTAEEKNAHPECDVLGGYLKRYDYQEAFRRSFREAKEGEDWPDELAKLKAIPNFDYKIFEEISGISKEELES